MATLVISATSFEIAPFLEFLRDRKNNLSHDIDVLITGVGMVSTTYALMKQIQIKRPAFILQAGIAGCFDRNFPLSGVVAIKQDTVADLGVMEKQQWESVFDLGFIRSNQFPWRKNWLINNSEKIKACKLPKVKAITVNEISTSKKKIDAFRDAWDPMAETLEGAALHYVSLMENIPFLQIRSFSNDIGERNKKKWELKKSIDNLNCELIKYCHP